MSLFLILCLTLGAGDQLAVELEPGTNPMNWAERHHLSLIRALNFLPDFYLFESLSNAPVAQARHLRESGHVRWAEIQERRPKRYTRAIPDPLWQLQWSLHGHPFGIDIDQVGNLTGAGVTIAIVDDGLQWTHPEIRINYDAQHSWDYNDNDADPMPVGAHSGHGTSAAGVASAAADNGHCGRGVAPKAKIVGLRTIAEGVTDTVEAEALTHNGIGIVDIYSNSWGPVDSGESMEGPGYVVQSALSAYAGALRGRLGKGTIYLWASGNGAAKGDSCAYDGYASSPYVFAIGAVNHQGHIADYSEGCASLFAVAPSSGAGRGITTADLMGGDGYVDGECTIGFGGTSAATPLAAGLIALLLEAEPLLSWHDLQYVLARGALKIDPNYQDWSTNREGFHHSHRYGFGLLHGPSLLRALASHTLLANRSQVIWQSGFKNLEDTWIGSNTTLVLNVTGAGAQIAVIERVSLSISLNTPNRGGLSFDLTSPEGITSHMAPARPRDGTPFWPSGWIFHSVRHFGERSVNGIWCITARDEDPTSVGESHFIGYELIIRGAPK